MKGIAAAFAVALLISFAITPAVARLAVRRGVLAIPRDRDVHVKPIPRWGGIAIWVGYLLASLAAISYRHFATNGSNGWSMHLVGIILAGTFIAAIGLVDDVKELSALKQTVAILAAAGILIAFGVRVEGISNPFVQHHHGNYTPAQFYSLALVPSILLTAFWVFVVTKTVDAIDGLDGLAAGVCAISAASLAYIAVTPKQPDGPAVALMASALAGACLGFLRWNYHPARIFMSTVGAQFIGLTLAALAIEGTSKIAAAMSMFVPILLMGVPIFDYGIVIARRILHRAPITQADKRHLHHRLLDYGLSHPQAVVCIWGISLVMCFLAIWVHRQVIQ